MSHQRFVYVGGFEENITKETIQSIFLSFGEILSIQLPLEPNSSKNRGFCIIEYELIQDAEEAINNMNLRFIFHETKSSK
jgi:RNA recognition motif-containing protein